MLEACTLLTHEEIASVMAEEIKETKKLEENERGFHVSMCLFALPTAGNSITVRLVQRAPGADGRDPREAWNQSFSAGNLQAGAASPPARPGSPEKVPNLGDEAYWRGQKRGGALYVLKGNAYFRISLTDTRDKEAAIQKCSALAEMALKRL